MAAADGSTRGRRRPLWAGAAVVALLLGGYATYIVVASPLTVSGGEVRPTAGSTRLPGGGYSLNYAPEGEVGLVVHLTNRGRFDVRLTGVDLPWVSDDPWETPNALQDLRRVLVGPDGTERPLKPVTVAPGQTVRIGWHLVMCPPPSRPPSKSPTSVDDFVVTYRYAGWRRGHTETLPQRLILPGNVCP
ncbi:hypothetical protein E1200_24870 [Actinomadura sp. GC306]|uniref:hypothetical protein n=1 Tax=Actinomadura sp. GC306 TaxID=2530367 RepID=UPI00104E466B|nr:hypothetical protein [Actinomadura sp. GC306]TDC62691.1 hypothetical protein E1200_24870 [Actinomadura sp. GC306]